MQRVPISTLSCALALLIATAAPIGAAERPPPCEAQVDQALADLEIDAAERREITIKPVLQSRRNGDKLVGYQAWVRLNACDGALVVELKPQCQLREVYTRGDCELEDVKSY